MLKGTFRDHQLFSVARLTPAEAASHSNIVQQINGTS
jgi:hypothetical protein